MKLKLTCMLSLMICPLLANQIRQQPKGAGVARSKKIDQPDVHRSADIMDDEWIDFDVDIEEELNTQELIPLWARLANKVAAPFFVLYNNFSRWWNTQPQASRLKKTSYLNMKQF